jgi:MFS family permease
MYRLALVWWVLQATGSGLAMGTVLVFQTVPLLAFVLIGGVVVDRFEPLKIMMVSDVVRAVITSYIAVSAYLGALELWHVYIASAAFGFVDAFFDPAYAATIPKVTRRDDLSSANAVTSLSTQVMRIAGPGLGALCVSTVGTSLVFYIDAVTFVISFFFILALAGMPPATLSPSQLAEDDFTGLEMNSLSVFTTFGTSMGSPGGTVSFIRPHDLDLDDHKVSLKSRLRGFVKEARVGFKVVLSKPYFWTPLLVASVINAFEYSAFILVMPYLLTRTLGLDVGAFGILQSLSAVGIAVATIVLGQRAKLRKRGRILFVAAFAIGLSAAAFAAPITIYGIGVFVTIRALASGAIDMTFLSVLQDKVPPEKLGRVFAIDSFVSMLLAPIGLAAVGWATDRFDPRTTFIIVGLIVVVFSFGLRQSKIRKLN